jgi:hypothetical protein
MEVGTLLKEEAVAVQDDMDSAASASRILYVSTDARWNSGKIPVSGMLFIPKGETPAGGWPLLSWAHGTLGLADRCAPSWTGLRPRDASYLNRWLAAGFAIAATDYQGLGGPGPHPYHHWQAEGRSVLDAARAVVNAKQGVISNRVFIGGQSQGAGAAMGAAMLAADHASDLNVIGAMPTGLGSEFPEGPVKIPPRMSSTMLLEFASGGLADKSPPLDELFNANGQALLQAAAQGCTGDVKEKAKELGVDSIEDINAVPVETIAKLRRYDRTMQAKRLGFPILIGTGLADATITPEYQFAAASALCAADNTVLWRTYPKMGHDGALHASVPDTVAFARSLLNGEQVQSNCATIKRPGPPQERDPDAPFNED